MPGKRSAAKRTYTEQTLYDYAVFMLGRRMRTVAELKRLMRARAAHQPDCQALVEAVTARLKQQRYLNDTGYAASYSASRRENQKFGPRRVAEELKARGVHPELVAESVAAAYNGVDEALLLRQYAARKRLAPPADQKQAARLFRQMARAGFSSRVIVRMLRSWKVEEETLSELEQEREQTDLSSPVGEEE